MPKSSRTLLPAGLVVFAAIIRWFRLGAEPLWLDEIYSVRFVASRSLGQVIVDTFHMDFHPFAHYALLDVWVDLFGTSATAARSLSVLLSLVSLITVYRLAMLVTRDRRVAVTAMALLTVAPFHLHYAREARMYMLMIALWPLCLEGLIRATRSGFRASTAVVFFPAWLLFAYSHAASSLLGLSVALPMLWLLHTRDPLRWSQLMRRRLVWMAGTVLIVVPWGLRLMLLRDTTKALSAVSGHTLVSFPFRILFHTPWPGLQQTLGPFAWLMAGALVILVAVYAVHRYRRPEDCEVDWLWLSLLTPMAVLVLIGLVKPAYQVRNLSLAVGPLFVLLAHALVTVRDRISRRGWQRVTVLAMVLLLVAPMMLWSASLLTHDYHGEDWPAVVRWLRARRHPGDTMVFFADYGSWCVGFYDHGPGATRLNAPPADPTDYTVFRLSKNPEQHGTDRRALITHLRQEAPDRVWTVYYPRIPVDQLEEVFLDHGYEVIDEWRSREIVVRGYESGEKKKK
jgi:hypothetical protein